MGIANRNRKFTYDVKRSNITLDEISERIAALMQYKRQKTGVPNMSKVAHVFVDTETTGLNPKENIILEVGIVLTDIVLEKIDSFSLTVTDDLSIQHLDWLETMAAQEPNFRGQEPWSGARYVHEMHQKNGLATEIRADNATGNRRSLAEVSHKAADFLRSYNVAAHLNAVPMTGSSIMFDRGFIQEQMPALNEAFHYRNVDISSMKTLVDMYRDDLRTQRRNDLSPVGAHRALSDIDDSIGELKFYLESLYRKDLGS